MTHVTFFVDESRAFFSPSRLMAEVWMEVELGTLHGPERKRFVTKVQTLPYWTNEDAIESAFTSFRFDEFYHGDASVTH